MIVCVVMRIVGSVGTMMIESEGIEIASEEMIEGMNAQGFFFHFLFLSYVRTVFGLMQAVQMYQKLLHHFSSSNKGA